MENFFECSIQGPLNQRSDLKKAKQTCKRLYQENKKRSLEVEANLSLQSHKSGNGLTSNLKALMNTITDLKLVQGGDTKLLPRCSHIHHRHHTGSQAAIVVNVELGLVANVVLD